MNTFLLGIDECESADTGVFALVGVAVPANEVNAIRERLYGFFQNVEGAPPRTITMPPELHGSKMLQVRRGKEWKDLPWATEEHKFRCFEEVVRVVNDFKLQVIRIAYVKRSLGPFGHQKSVHGLCFLGILWSIRSLLEGALVLPVVDGFDTTTQYAQPIKAGDVVATYVGPDAVSIKHRHNLLEPVFASSHYSTPIQLADVVAFLLHLEDRKRLGLPLPPFKERLLALRAALDPDLVRAEEPIVMQHESAPARSGDPTS